MERKLKNLFVTMSVCVFCTSLNAGYVEKKDIAYYDEKTPKSGNVEYLNERCKLDFYYPDDVKNFPTVIFFHGGGLTSGNKYIPEFLKNRKIAVAAVNYRLSGDKAAAPDYLYDAAAAIAWTLSNVKQYGGDESMIFVSGHSAGAYLAAMTGMDARYLAAFGCKPEQLTALVPISGQMTTHLRILEERRKSEPATPPLFIDAYAPIFHAKKQVPRIMIFTGDPKIDMPARAEENIFFASYLTRVAGHEKTDIYVMPGYGHGSVIKPALYLLMIKIQEMQKAKDPSLKIDYKN